MKPLLHNIISSNQSAFIPGRAFQDNIIIAHEMFHALKLNKSFHDVDVAVNINLNKAYNKLE